MSFRIEQAKASGNTKCGFCKNPLKKDLNVGLFLYYVPPFMRKSYWHIDCLKRNLNINLPNYFQFTKEDIQKDYQESQ